MILKSFLNLRNFESRNFSVLNSKFLQQYIGATKKEQQDIIKKTSLFKKDLNNYKNFNFSEKNGENSLKIKFENQKIKDEKALQDDLKRNITSTKLLKVAIIGSPNAGKSTLANKLIGWKFAPVSSKVHTTRKNTLGVLTQLEKQVVFLDTPGIIVPSKRKKHNLELSLLVDPHQALIQSDTIVVVVDVSHLWNRSHLDHEVLKILHHHGNKESILVLNKIDLLKNKNEVLNAIRILTRGHLNGIKYDHKNNYNEKNKNYILLQNLLKKDKEKIKKNEDENGYESEFKMKKHDENNLSFDNNSSISDNEHNIKKIKCNQFSDINNKENWKFYYEELNNIGRVIKNEYGWPYFKNVFLVSALNNDGVTDLKSYLLNSTKPSDWMFNEFVVTNQDPVSLAQQMIREKLLDNLEDEIPYQIPIKLIMWHIGEDGLLRAQFDLLCSNKRQLHKILGKNGSNIKKISTEIKQELMNAFKREMTFQLIVRGNKKTLPKLKTEIKS